MAKGQIIQLTFTPFKDSDSGVNVIRLTPPDVLCHRNYFYQKCFTNDGQKLLFGAEFDGYRNYYLLDIKEKTAKQLTEGAGDNTFGGFLSPNDDYLFYVKGERNLQRVDLNTLEEQTIYSVPDDWVAYGTWVANTECTSIVGIMIDKSDWTPLSDWSIFHDFFHKKPHCRLFKIDLTTGEVNIVLDQKIWLGHPIYRPFDDSTIAFCHEGPHDLVDARMWLINQDGSNERVVRNHVAGESCTHEFWIPDGSGLAYVSYLKGEQERYIRQYNPETNIDTLLMKMPACSHLNSNFDGSLFIGDGSGSPADVTDSDGYSIENDPWLYIMRPADKAIIRLVKHNSSWRVLDGDRQVTHPHPSFSPDGKKVLFTTDFEGKPALYLSDVPESILGS